MNHLEEFVMYYPELDGKSVRDAYAVYTLWTSILNVKPISRSNFAVQMGELGFKISLNADNVEIFTGFTRYLLIRINQLEVRVKELEEGVH